MGGMGVLMNECNSRRNDGTVRGGRTTVPLLFKSSDLPQKYQLLLAAIGEGAGIDSREPGEATSAGKAGLGRPPLAGDDLREGFGCSTASGAHAVHLWCSRDRPSKRLGSWCLPIQPLHSATATHGEQVTMEWSSFIGQNDNGWDTSVAWLKQWCIQVTQRGNYGIDAPKHFPERHSHCSSGWSHGTSPLSVNGVEIHCNKGRRA